MEIKRKIGPQSNKKISQIYNQVFFHYSYLNNLTILIFKTVFFQCQNLRSQLLELLCFIN